MLNENKVKYIKFHSKLFNDKRLDKMAVIIYGVVEYLSNNEKGVCTASNETLADYLDCSKSTVIRSINNLVDCNYLKRKNINAPNSKNIIYRELKPSSKNDTTLVANLNKGSSKNDTRVVAKMNKPSGIDDTLKELYKKNYIKEDLKELSNIKNTIKEDENLMKF